LNLSVNYRGKTPELLIKAVGAKILLNANEALCARRLQFNHIHNSMDAQVTQEVLRLIITMVTAAATRTYLRSVIGLGNNNEGLERAEAIMAEGLDNLADIYELAEGDGIKRLCSNVRKLAGTVPQPGWVAPNPNPDQLVLHQVPRTGKVVPAICEQRLKLAAYGAAIYQSIGRGIDPTSLNRARLRAFKEHRTTVENHNDPGPLPEISKSYTVMKYPDQLPNYLREMLGVTKVPLAYLIRERKLTPIEMQPPEELPALIGGHAPKPWSTGKDTMMDELIEYTPHRGAFYDADNAQLYNILVTHLGNTSAMASITQYQRRRNGKQAYKDLVTHYMG